MMPISALGALKSGFSTKSHDSGAGDRTLTERSAGVPNEEAQWTVSVLSWSPCADEGSGLRNKLSFTASRDRLRIGRQEPNELLLCLFAMLEIGGAPVSRRRLPGKAKERRFLRNEGRAALSTTSAASSGSAATSPLSPVFPISRSDLSVQIPSMTKKKQITKRTVVAASRRRGLRNEVATAHRHSCVFIFSKRNSPVLAKRTRAERHSWAGHRTSVAGGTLGETVIRGK
jgi:hypothetical protein